MSDLDPYFAETMPDDERLANVTVLTHGVVNGLSYFLGRMSSYYDLMELELDDSPSGQIYLKESFAALERSLRMLDSLRDHCCKPGQDFESFDLLLLVSGVSRRLAEIHLAKLDLDSSTIDGQQAFVRGQQFLLQQILFEIPALFGIERGASTPLSAQLQCETVEEAFFQSQKCELTGGDYYVLSISRTGDAPPLSSMASLMQKLFSCRRLELGDRLIFASGTVLEHGGDIFVNKEGDELESLAIVLPTARNSSTIFNEETVDEEALKGDETILLVDDEGIVWDVVIDMLQNLGYTVVLAENGVDCVEIYRENPGQIDLILLDMVMPKMNGHEAFFKLREIDPNVRVMLQSGYINQKEAQEVLQAGALGFLQKPYRMQALARKMRDILDA